MTFFNRSVNCESCEKCNNKSPLFRILSEEELEIINEGRYEVVFKPGENLIKQGTAATHVLSLTSGIAKMYIEGLDNKNLILEIIKPWKLFGGQGVFIDNRYHYSVTAIEPTSACFIDAVNLKKVIRSNPDFAELFISNCSLNSVNIFKRMVSLTQKQMPGRIADVLLYLSKDVYNNASFEISLSRQDIGDLSSMTKDSAIRILKDFEAEGIIQLVGKHFSILKKEVLEEISIRG
jgi:CRP/FNR family transcriptional regulator, polysaccharide utilization system transcription regulator